MPCPPALRADVADASLSSRVLPVVGQLGARQRGRQRVVALRAVHRPFHMNEVRCPAVLSRNTLQDCRLSVAFPHLLSSIFRLSALRSTKLRGHLRDWTEFYPTGWRVAGAHLCSGP